MRKTAQMTACALRSFLRFLHDQRIFQIGLADTVPAVAHRSLSGLPQPLNQVQVIALLDACDRSTGVGRRDFAVITVLQRLGLRSGELCGLRLDDVDWQAGVLTIHGKGDRTDRLPLRVDVGRAIVDYLRDGRPETTARTLFVKAVAPHTPMAYSGLSCIVVRSAQRVGLGTTHTHRLRHTAASCVLNAGASLERSRTCSGTRARPQRRTTRRLVRLGWPRWHARGRSAAVRHEHLDDTLLTFLQSL